MCILSWDFQCERHLNDFLQNEHEYVFSFFLLLPTGHDGDAKDFPFIFDKLSFESGSSFIISFDGFSLPIHCITLIRRVPAAAVDIFFI